jgi:hypothetical protein
VSSYDDYQMSRIGYNNQVSAVGGGRRNSNGSSEDSDTATMRDESAMQMPYVQHRSNATGQSATWSATSTGSYVDYDPSYPYSSSGLTADGTYAHELHHEQAYTGYSHPQDPDLSAVNFNLPGASADDPALAASFGAQSTVVDQNYETLRQMVNNDPRSFPPGSQLYNHVIGRIDYAQATPHQHNESVAVDLYSTLNQSGLSNSQAGRQVAAIYAEARNRRLTGGQTVAPVGASSHRTRTSAHGNSMPRDQGGKGHKSGEKKHRKR